jgi:hypothetical protein
VTQQTHLSCCNDASSPSYMLTQSLFGAGASLAHRRSARGIFAARGQNDPFDRQSQQAQPMRFSCSSPPGRVYTPRTNYNRSGRPLGLSGLVLHSLAARTLGTPLCVPVLVFNGQLLHTNVNHSAYCEPLGCTSSGPPGRLSACERSLDSHSGPLRLSLQHHLGNCQQQV